MWRDCFLLLFLAAVPCLGEVRNVAIRWDSRSLIVIERFGYGASGGGLEISASRVALHSTSDENVGTSVDPSRMGFFMTTDADLLQFGVGSNPLCPLDGSKNRLLFTLAQLHSTFHNYSGSFHIPQESSQEFVILFANCQRHVRVSMDVKLAMYNFAQDGHTRDYLSVGESHLPLVLFLFAANYIGLTIFWASVIAKQRENSHKIHFLMLFLLLLKMVNLAAEGIDLEFTRKTGTPHGWDVVFYLFSFLRGVTMFTVVILIGTGWSILKPFLQEREKKVLMVVIPLQVLTNMASIAMDETGPASRDFVTWKQLLLLMDIICCCAVLFPIVWSIKHLREGSRTDGKAARNLARLTLFRQYYILVVGYVYFTRIAVFALAAVIGFRYRWVAILIREAATIGFYVFTGYKFRPAERKSYISLDEDDQDEENLVVMEPFKDDDFEL